MFARFINIFIAMWVLVTAFAFDNPTSLFISMVAVAILVMAVEALSFFATDVRFGATVLGAWLLISGFVLPAPNDFIVWSNFLCGVTIAVLSMFRTRVRQGPWVSETRREAEVR